MNVSVVIPNLNGEKYLDRCIKSLLAQTTNCKIIVVDNNSSDNSLKVLSKFPAITILKQTKNLGFAGGVNRGIKHAMNNNTDYIALFNNDATASKNWLKNLLDTAQSSNKVGIVTGKFLKTDGKTIDSTGDFYTIYGLPYPRGRNEVDIGQYDNSTDVFAGSGGASLYSVKMLQQIGLFDEDFFAYFEDVDISFRARLAGWLIKYEPKALAYHHVGATSAKISGFGAYQTAKNIPLLYLKNVPGVLFFKYLPFTLYWYLRMAVARIIRGGFWVFIKGWLMSLALAPKKIVRRRTIQKHRKVSTRIIDQLIIHKRPPKLIK